MIRILLTGSTDQVGWELQQTLMTVGEVITAGREVSSPGLHMDLSRVNLQKYRFLQL